jgi:hypothetical protein
LLQLTTWNPTPANATHIPSGPIDYAGKHWSGLIADYYARRASMLLHQATSDAAASASLNTTAVLLQQAQLAYAWTTASNVYPVQPVGDALNVSQAMFSKYAHVFAACA